MSSVRYNTAPVQGKRPSRLSLATSATNSSGDGSATTDLPTPARDLQFCQTPFVDLSARGLSSIPDNIPEDVYSISLHNNMIVELPASFGRSFMYLNILDVSNNQLTSLPDGIRHLGNLRELYANKNALISLPITLGSLRSLEVLELSENYLTTLDISISRLENLKMLNVSDNQLTSLPPYIGLLAQNLRILLIDGNPFEKSQRGLIEPILTISAKEAKKIAKAKEKAEKLRAKAIKKGESVSSNAHISLHDNAYSTALKNLVSVRLRRHDSNRSTKDKLQKTSSFQVDSTSKSREDSKIKRSLSVSSSHIAQDSTLRLRPSTMVPPVPQLTHTMNSSNYSNNNNNNGNLHDSAVFSSESVTDKMATMTIATEESGYSPYIVPISTPPASRSKAEFVAWDRIVADRSEVDEYMSKKLPPAPNQALVVSSPVTPTSARNVALSIARQIATGSMTSPTLADPDTSSSPAHGYSTIGTRHSSSYTSGSNVFSTRDSTCSTSHDSHSSGKSYSSSFDDSAGLIQDATKVGRVLWQLRDEWDLDPEHSEAETVENMLTQQREGNVRIDGSSEIDRMYREKVTTAGTSQRMKILSELLVTEVTYVDTLKNVVGVYLNPMRETRVLSETELRDIFSNIEVILAFHTDHFLPAITYAISQPSMAIGEVFLNLGPHFRLYSTYTNNHDTSAKVLKSVQARRGVSSFIQNARQDVTQIGQVGLDGHLLTPIQRLPRYRMLLTDLLSNTPPEHPDHETLYMALKELNKTIHSMNEKKRTYENQIRLRQIQDKVSGTADIPLVVPHRKFKMMANFRLQILSEPVTGVSGYVMARRIGVSTVYRFILFNDMILQCTIIMNKDFRLNRIYYLSTRVTPAEITCDNELRIVDADGVLYLKGDSSELRKWAHAINNRLDS